VLLSRDDRPTRRPVPISPTVDSGTMRQVSDAFLLNMAEVSATLIGLFLVGVSF
jgi:hypothetical protein